MQFRNAHLMQFRNAHLMQFRNAHLMQFRNARLMQFRSAHLMQFRNARLMQFRSGHLMQFRNAHLIDWINLPPPPPPSWAVTAGPARRATCWSAPHFTATSSRPSSPRENVARSAPPPLGSPGPGPCPPTGPSTISIPARSTRRTSSTKSWAKGGAMWRWVGCRC